FPVVTSKCSPISPPFWRTRLFAQRISTKRLLWKPRRRLFRPTRTRVASSTTPVPPPSWRKQQRNCVHSRNCVARRSVAGNKAECTDSGKGRLLLPFFMLRWLSLCFQEGQPAL